MKSAKRPLDEKTLLLWGSFALGFLFPYAFLLFLLLALRPSCRELRKEYGGVAAYWRAFFAPKAPSAGPRLCPPRPETERARLSEAA